MADHGRKNSGCAGDAAGELSEIFADADEKMSESRAPEPSIDEINGLCERARAERAQRDYLHAGVGSTDEYGEMFRKLADS